MGDRAFAGGVEEDVMDRCTRKLKDRPKEICHCESMEVQWKDSRIAYTGLSRKGLIGSKVQGRRLGLCDLNLSE